MEEERYLKRQRIYKTIMLVILTVFLTFTITTLYITNQFNLGENKGTSLLNLSSNNDSLSKSIKQIKRILDEQCLTDVDEEKAEEWAIRAYVSSLGDPYTQYIPKDEMEEYKTNLMGNFVGIGIYMIEDTKKDTIEIVMPIKGSPAEEAGILAGDTIVSVNGVKYTGKDIDVAADEIKGKEGTVVKLEILRKQEVKTFEITRRKVYTNPVESKKMENNIGYIQVTSFDETTAEGFKTAFEGLKKEGITSLIIDLRNNGGGLVDSSLKIADYIVPKGKDLLVTVDKDKKEKIEKTKQDVLVDMPIVVLVNENSASATEILAGALKDLDEATIVGTKTFGKGVIQELLPFRDGSALKVTVQEYYTPNRNKINEVGIEPNVVVELPEGVDNPYSIDTEKDTQLQKAIELLK